MKSLRATARHLRCALISTELAIVLMFLAAAVLVMAWEWRVAGPSRECRHVKILHSRQ